MSDKSMEQERSRIRAILGCEEAKGREQMARHLAFDTDIDLQAARKLLAAASKSGARNEAFFAAMEALGNPMVGIGGAEAALPLALSAKTIYAARRAAVTNDTRGTLPGPA